MRIVRITTTIDNSPTPFLSCIIKERAYIPSSDPGLSDTNPSLTRNTLRDVLIAVAGFIFLVAVFYAVDRWLEWNMECRFEKMLNHIRTTAAAIFEKCKATIRRNSRGQRYPVAQGNIPLEAGVDRPVEGR